MNVNVRKNKDGTTTYSIRYWNLEGKNKRLPQTSHPKFTSYEEALEWAKSQEANFQAKKSAALRKLEWQNKYYQYSDLRNKYETWIKERAPNYWKKNVQYLEHYIFDFFISEQKANNVNDWHLFFRGFRD